MSSDEQRCREITAVRCKRFAGHAGYHEADPVAFADGSSAPSLNQSRVTEWVRKVFTEAEATNAPERSLRVVEEAIELAQACGIDAEALHRMVDYVCGRPIGEAPKEIAGCLVTVYAAAAALGVDAQEELEIELSRIHRPEVIDRVRRRQKEKREALVAFDPVVQPIEDLPGARASSGLEGPKRTSPHRPHLINGEFQSDKYPTTPRGKVPLSVKDVTAQDLLWEYAQRRRAVDAEFADDLEEALRIAGYDHIDAYRDTDAVRYALLSAIDQQIVRCGQEVSFRSLPDETVAEAFEEELERHGFQVRSR